LSAAAQNTERFHTKDNLPYFPVLTNAPENVSAGAIYINSSDSCAYRYSGTEWIPCRVGTIIPAAKQVAITTDVVATGKVTGTYIFIPDDAFASPESGSTYQWYQASDSIGTDSTAISGATELSYTVDLAVGQYLAFCVTPKNSKSYTGKKTFSNWTKVTAPVDTASDGTLAVKMYSPSGQVWMDRNLGASQLADSATDYNAYGSLFQWCRAADGHQLINWTSSTTGTAVNDTTSTLSTTITPSHSKFIVNTSSPDDWLSTQLTSGNIWWNGSSPGINNPCPDDYHVPTYTEWSTEETIMSNNGNDADAAYSLLKLPMAGYRSYSYGSLYYTGSNGLYWSSTVNSSNAYRLYFNSSDAHMYSSRRAYGFSIRCIKDQITDNDRPSATSVSINGNVYVDSTVTGTYTYTADASTSSTEGTSTYQWYYANDASGSDISVISGATSASYTIASPVVNEDYLALGVTPVASNGVKGKEILSTWQKVSELAYDGTEVVDLVSSSGRIWMDRNLGATQAATSSTDYNAYGSLFQWCRAPDGHELITWTSSTSGTAVNDTTSTLSTTTAPGHSNFIINSTTSPYDWLSTQESDGSLWWNGSSVGANNPCPTGYHVPTYTELNTEYAIINSNGNDADAAYSLFKFPLSGYREREKGGISNQGTCGYCWSSTINSNDVRVVNTLYFTNSLARMNVDFRAHGFPVRCIKDE